ncbi:hypothetical protein Clacol_002070 [Clathrus columnatus]|uniref:Beta-lactamase-related domain-containing protein n=1 Tax=Clathrus columnatus TaxID=1419009 RepID=A0AAV5A3M8_9AGAM|nr:hypothetical protein Clacol_002070 [Clathrus columnatus]
MSSTDFQNALQACLDKAIVNGVTPALQCIVINKEKILHNTISGLASTPSASPPDGKPFTNDSALLLASCNKVVLSIVALSVLDKRQVKTGMGIEHLDDHEKLVEILPEFSPSSGSPLTKILEGFEEGVLDSDGRKVMKLKYAKTKITLRMLLTHTAGMVCDWTHPLMAELYAPTDGSVPHKQPPWQLGRMSDHEVPLIFEPDTTYATSPDWIALFLTRATGKSLRTLYQEHVKEPLGIPKDDFDVFRSPEIERKLADIYVRTPTGDFFKVDLVPYATEDIPPPGYMVYASGAFWGTSTSFALFIQALLREDTRLLSKAVWDIATVDDIGPRGIRVPSPEMPYANPMISATFDNYIDTIPKGELGVNLLQAKVTLSKTVTGRSVGSYGWAGAANTHWVVDPSKEIAIVFVAHFLPFMEPRVIETRNEIEKLIFDHLERLPEIDWFLFTRDLAQSVYVEIKKAQKIVSEEGIYEEKSRASLRL